MNKVKETIRAIKYRLHPQFRYALDANPNYEQKIKALTRSPENLPESFEIRGWALHSDGPITLRWSYKNDCIAELNPWLTRIDVQEVFSFISHSLTCGFRFQIPTELLSKTPAETLQLEAVKGSQIQILWKNSFDGQNEADDLQTVLAKWKESVNEQQAAYSGRSTLKVGNEQVLVLCKNPSTPLSDSCEQLLNFLSIDSEPLQLSLADVGKIAPVDNDIQSDRPIIVESDELIEQAFLLKYLVGGVVHTLSDKVSLSTLANYWSPKGVASNPLADLPENTPGISVIVPVYNALDVTLRCLQSLLPSLGESDEVIIVSDASDSYVNQQLQSFVEKHHHFIFVKRVENGGFVEACWSGFDAANNENDILLLNSDTVLASGSLASFKDQMYLRKTIAMGSPLSTGSPNFELALSPGEDFFAAAKRLKNFSKSTPFSAITPEGQCLYIKRWGLERFGFLDRVYGRGFCEESDLAMRMFAAGAELICLGNDLIHHERSASFGSYQRLKQLERNRPIFEERWGNTYSIAYSAFKKRTHLAKLRREWDSSRPQNPLQELEIAFVLPELITAGGHLSVIQHVNEMIIRGRKAGIITHKAAVTDALGLLTEPIVMSEEELRNEKKLPAHLVATMWSTAKVVFDVAKSALTTTPWYYIQDYEPWFYDRTDQETERSAARSSYELDVNMVAKTEFLCSLVQELHGRQVLKVCPGIARNIFYPGSQTSHKGTPRLAALYRPDKARRGTDLLLAVLDELLARNSNVEINLFGSSDIEACHPALRKRIHFLGPLPSVKVAELYRNSDVVCDLSLWHGFGRMGIEAMACGAVPVLSESGGIKEYAKHEENSLIVSDRPEEVAIALNRLLQDDVYRHQLRQTGLDSFKWSEVQATSDWLHLFDSKRKEAQAA